MTYEKASPQELAGRLKAILDGDMDRLLKIDRYARGEHDDPYMPDEADAEYQLLAKRAITNWCGLAERVPVQSLYVDNCRRGTDKPGEDNDKSPEWQHFERSRMRARQTAVHEGAIRFGHSFVLTEKDARGKIISKGLSALKTAALFVDPANDITPYAALTILHKEKKGVDDFITHARLWVHKHEYKVAFRKGKAAVYGKKAHGSSAVPITRFAAHVDLEGRTSGLIEPLIPVQDRINQTIFDLLMGQTWNSFKVRTVSGMAPPLKMELKNAEDIAAAKAWNDANPDSPRPIPEEEWGPQLDAQGQPIVDRIKVSQRSNYQFAEDPEVKFGTLDETPLDGFIAAAEKAIRDFSALAQIPPHHVLGQIANLSAEALEAAEKSLDRLVELLQTVFSESWEQVFRIARELDGDGAAMEDFGVEVVWRDLESRSLSKTADALGKMRESLDIPRRGLWAMVPGVTSKQLGEWNRLADEEEPELALANANIRATRTPMTDDLED